MPQGSTARFTEDEEKHLMASLRFQLRKLIEDRAIPKEMIADAIGVHPSLVSHMLNGPRKLSMKSAFAIALACNHTIEVKLVQQ